MSVSLTTSATAVQPSVTSTGIGSGVNVSSLVSSLVSAAITPKQTLLTNRQSTDQATISALGTVKAALSGLQSQVDSISTGGALKQLVATTGDSSVFTAAAASGAVAGSYQVEVLALASANTIGSSPLASSSTAVGAGAYAITAGGKSFTVNMNATNTLGDLRDAINSSSSNTGVTATIVNGSDGAHLLLSATQTGAANAVSISTPGSLTFSTITPASDAEIKVAGIDYTSSSNNVSGALDGVTLNLASAKPGTKLALTVSANQTAASGAVQSFVAAYNAALNYINSSTAYSPGATTGTSTAAGSGGPLLGDLTVQRLSQQLQTIVGSDTGASSGISRLSQIGVTENSDGTLSVDNSKLGAALQSNPAGVQALFSGANGVGTQLDTLMTSYVGAGGALDSETKGVQSELDDISSKLTELNQRQQDLQARYLAQFNAMDTQVGKYKSIASFLSTYSTSLNNVSSSSK